MNSVCRWLFLILIFRESMAESGNHNFYPMCDDVIGRQHDECHVIDEVACCTGWTIDRIPWDFSPNISTMYRIRRDFTLRLACPLLGVAADGLKKLYHTGIVQVGSRDLENYTHLTELMIYDAPHLTSVSGSAFQSLTKLTKLSVTRATSLNQLDGPLMLTCAPRLTIQLSLNNLDEIPIIKLAGCPDGTEYPIELSLTNNRIREIMANVFSGLQLKSLDLRNNALLTQIHDFAFNNSKLLDLDLANNSALQWFGDQALSSANNLQSLDISRTSLKTLPARGLKQLKILKAEKLYTMKQLPPLINFMSLETAILTYPYHCCMFKHADPAKWKSESETGWAGMDDSDLEGMRMKYCSNSSNAALVRRKRGFGLWGFNSNRTRIFKTHSVTRTVMPIPDYMTPIPDLTQNAADGVCNDSAYDGVKSYYRQIQCTPEPNDLNPCEDVMGNVGLRIIIWIVWISAIAGNSMVIVTMLVARNPKRKVHNFLMVNLAIADLCMGIYLAMLAVVDVQTAGEYYNFAVDWQTGTGCRAAGFLALFASELSIWIMTLISFEVWYNTKYGFRGNRFEFHNSAIATAAGWLFSIVIASLPLIGVSSYSGTSTCLPMGVETPHDRAFLICVLLINLFGFMAICYFYISIYTMVRGSSSPTAQAQDVVIAKRMSLLIGTDFICWAPTVFFGLTAAAQQPLISISIAKIFLVVFYPINGCTNPFLYVFGTRFFRKEMNRFMRKHSVVRKINELKSGGKASTESRQPILDTQQRNGHSRIRTTTATSVLKSITPPRSSESLNRLNLKTHGEWSPRNVGKFRAHIPRPDKPQRCDSEEIPLQILKSAENTSKTPRKNGIFRPRMSDIIEGSGSQNSQSDHQLGSSSYRDVSRHSTVDTPAIEFIDKTPMEEEEPAASDALLGCPQAMPILLISHCEDPHHMHEDQKHTDGKICSNIHTLNVNADLRRRNSDTSCASTTTGWGGLSTTDVSYLSSDSLADLTADDEATPTCAKFFVGPSHGERPRSLKTRGGRRQSEVSCESGYDTNVHNTPVEMTHPSFYAQIANNKGIRPRSNSSNATMRIADPNSSGYNVDVRKQ